MLYFIVKSALSGLLIAAVSTIAKRSPGFGGLVASLPMISVMGMLWLWLDTHDPVRMERQVSATFWFFLPSMPMFLLIPAMLRFGAGFYISLTAGCVVTIVLYSIMVWLAPRFGISL